MLVAISDAVSKLFKTTGINLSLERKIQGSYPKGPPSPGLYQQISAFQNRLPSNQRDGKICVSLSIT